VAKGRPGGLIYNSSLSHTATQGIRENAQLSKVAEAVSTSRDSVHEPGDLHPDIENAELMVRLRYSSYQYC